MEIIFFQGDGAAGTLSLGNGELTMTKTGTGDYTLTLKKGAASQFLLGLSVQGRHDTYNIVPGLHATGSTTNAVRFRLERSDTNALIDVPFTGFIYKKTGRIDFS
jgi:hypothetical protein